MAEIGLLGARLYDYQDVCACAAVAADADDGHRRLSMPMLMTLAMAMTMVKAKANAQGILLHFASVQCDRFQSIFKHFYSCYPWILKGGFIANVNLDLGLILVLHGSSCLVLAYV